MNRDGVDGQFEQTGRPDTLARGGVLKGHVADGSSTASERTDRSRTTGAALEAHYQFVLWLVPALERFPRSQKFLLGDRVQGIALDVLESLIDATYTRERGSYLARANLGIEKLRFLLRLAHDLRYLDRRRYEHAARCLDETGRKIGAWSKAHRAHERTGPV